MMRHRPANWLLWRGIVTLFPQFAASSSGFKTDSGQVAALRDFEPTPWPVRIIYPARKLVPLKLRTFVDWVVPRLRERPAEDFCPVAVPMHAPVDDRTIPLDRT